MSEGRLELSFTRKKKNDLRIALDFASRACFQPRICLATDRDRHRGKQAKRQLWTTTVCEAHRQTERQGPTETNKQKQRQTETDRDR